MLKSKSKVYKEIFWINTIIVIFLIISLDIFFVRKLVLNTKEYQFYINEKVVNDVKDELNKVYDNSIRIVNDIYNDSTLTYDLIKFLSIDTISYLKQKLDKLSDSDDSYYIGVERFTKRAFTSNDNLKEISFVSFERNEISKFNRMNQISVQNFDKNKFYQNGKLLNMIGDKESIHFVREINNPINLNAEGLIILTYNLNYLKYIREKYNGHPRILLLDSNGYVVYDSNETSEYKLYKYYDEIINLDKNSKKDVMLDSVYCIETTISNSGINIISMLNSRDVKDLSYNIIILAVISLLLLMITQGIYYFKLKTLGNRTNNILNAMDKVKKGDLNIQIPLTSDSDEINYISEQFNNMCRDLNKYIDKSYKAEIEQRKAEMNSLQNQINPHFLYNTLESIRMKAICNGDREVGRMLYILSVLFRKQLKENNIISIDKELEYCIQYIEIFKFRYDDAFQFHIDCDDEIKGMQIPKLTLQPILENYFIHGIRLEDNDNLLCIKFEKEEDNIKISIKDNGHGIEKSKLDTINDNIKNEMYSGNSVGLINVHKRIILEYGKEYGISLLVTGNKETIVTIKIPCKGV